MMTDTSIEAKTRAAIQRIHDAVAERGWMAQAEFFAETHFNHGFEATRETTRAVLEDIQNTFPDIRFEPIQTFVQGDWVIEHCWFGGTHSGVAQHPYVHYGLLTGVPATGKTMRVLHTHLYRIQDGLIVEHFATRDDVGMVRQLGLELGVKGENA
jgi:predicted ester cyclase